MTYHAWIIYNQSLSSNKFADYAQSLSQAAQEKGHRTTLISNHELLVYLSTNSSLLTEKKLQADYCIFTDKDIYLAEQIEALGIPVFNNSKAIELSDDKNKSYLKLAHSKLPIPQTIIAPKTFTKPTTQYLLDVLGVVEKTLSYPFIIKEAFGSFGEQVYLIHNRQDALKLMALIYERPYLFQEYIKASHGKDIRLQVVGNEVVAAMLRTSKSDFRANITSGGTMKNYLPTEQEKSLAIQATKALNLDFAGVDLLFGKEDMRFICEVNSNAHIQNLYEATGVNVANYMIDYIESVIKK